MTRAEDARLAADLAGAAGKLLLQVRAAGAGDDPKDLGRQGDRQSNAYILGRLAEDRPGDAVLSEESTDDPIRLDSARVWIIDPLDGTREFTMPGRPDWAVHVALWEAGAGLTAAAVAQPSVGAVYATDDDVPPAERVEGAVASGSNRTRPLILVSDSRPPAWIGLVAAAVEADVAPMGSAGAKAMAVRRGDADAYVHAGGQWEWDSAAPVGVLQAAGFHTSRIDGSELLYNQPHPYLPDFVLCRPSLAEPLLAALAPYALEAG